MIKNRVSAGQKTINGKLYILLGFLPSSFTCRSEKYRY